MGETLQSLMEDTIWVAHSLFERGRTAGSTANISFRYNGQMYISRTGSCLGRLILMWKSEANVSDSASLASLFSLSSGHVSGWTVLSAQLSEDTSRMTA